ncbi:hypothetical protein GCM10027053_08430 [Intrasporangium mesophilum]
MTMEKGRERISDYVQEAWLQRVPASIEAAEGLIAKSRRHLASAERIADDDPQGAYVLTYDAARKAMAAVLEADGLRATSKGGHTVTAAPPMSGGTGHSDRPARWPGPGRAPRASAGRV